MGDSLEELAPGLTQLDLGGLLPPEPLWPLGRAAGPVESRYFRRLAECRKDTYDVVVVGGGAVGCAMVHRLLQRGFRVLLLEKGPFLLPEHVQNLDPVYQPLMTKAVAEPWDIIPKDGYGLAPQIPFLGGRALFWSTWIPQPTREQMPGWPDAVLDELRPYWGAARRLLGSVEPSDMGPEFDTFHPRLVRRLFDGLPKLSDFVDYSRERDLETPLASRATTSTLGYRKFSPVPLLLDAAVRYAVNGQAGKPRLSVVAECEVLGIEAKKQGGLQVAQTLLTSQDKFELNGTPVVLATGVIEPTGLLLHSFPKALSPLAGKNLGGHVANWFTVRVPRAAYPDLPDRLQISCTYLEGTHRPPGGKSADARDFHVHLMAASNPKPAEAVADLYRLIPDSFDQEFLTQLSDAEHIGFLVHCLGEWRGELTGASRVTVDKKGRPGVRIVPSAADLALEKAMEKAADALVGLLANGQTPQYWDKGWISGPPPNRRKKLLVHESGTLLMGNTPADSVTDHLGRPHGVGGVHVAGAATFPSSGSWNPTLAAVALGLRLADKLTKKEG